LYILCIVFFLERQDRISKELQRGKKKPQFLKILYYETFLIAVESVLKSDFNHSNNSVKDLSNNKDMAVDPKAFANYNNNCFNVDKSATKVKILANYFEKLQTNKIFITIKAYSLLFSNLDFNLLKKVTTFQADPHFHLALIKFLFSSKQSSLAIAHFDELLISFRGRWPPLWCKSYSFTFNKDNSHPASSWITAIFNVLLVNCLKSGLLTITFKYYKLLL
jgi:hypothetical protein